MVVSVLKDQIKVLNTNYYTIPLPLYPPEFSGTKPYDYVPHKWREKSLESKGGQLTTDKKPDHFFINFKHNGNKKFCVVAVHLELSLNMVQLAESY